MVDLWDQLVDEAQNFQTVAVDLVDKTEHFVVIQAGLVDL
jgi:hypothetical protein